VFARCLACCSLTANRVAHHPWGVAVTSPPPCRQSRRAVLSAWRARSLGPRRDCHSWGQVAFGGVCGWGVEDGFGCSPASDQVTRRGIPTDGLALFGFGSSRGTAPTVTDGVAARTHETATASASVEAVDAVVSARTEQHAWNGLSDPHGHDWVAKKESRWQST
jgi:hypothetical protein